MQPEIGVMVVSAAHVVLCCCQWRNVEQMSTLNCIA